MESISSVDAEKFVREIGKAQLANKEKSGKLRYSLIPHLGVLEEAFVYTMGAKKYDDDNWRKGLAFRDCIDAMRRHIAAYERGENRCPNDGQHHLGSVKFWCNALIEYEQTHPDLDNRVKDGAK